MYLITMTQNNGKRISVQRSYLERDLGIMIDSELNFSELPKKQMESWQSSKELLHVLIVSVSTCCTSHWSEHTLNTALQLGFHTKWRTLKLLKKIQKRATKQVKKIRHLIYSERLKRLNLPTLYVIDDTVVIWLKYIRSCTISMTKKSPQGFWIFQVTHQPEATP